MQTTFVLVHSPSVGPSTWAPVAESLERRGHAAVVPDLTGISAGGAPYWPRVVDAVRAATPSDGPVVLVAHSNAGFFLPVIKEGLGDRVVACVFADAHVPPGEGLITTAEKEFLPFLRDLAGPDGVLPAGPTGGTRRTSWPCCPTRPSASGWPASSPACRSTTTPSPSPSPPGGTRSDARACGTAPATPPPPSARPSAAGR
ncbi:hypothetical protein [Nonomuraea salmonea]|uniref:hypothetical protein n=1 Tax=Nonomuraea salmonea TaxID=46181 RepID=UPI0031E8B682